MSDNQIALDAFADMYSFARYVKYVHLLGNYVWVITDNPQYDDVLMDDLIDIEAQICRAYGELTFRYWPLALGDLPAPLLDDSTLAYERKSE